MSADALNKRAVTEPGGVPGERRGGVMLQESVEPETKQDRQKSLAVEMQRCQAVGDKAGERSASNLLIADLGAVIESLVKRWSKFGTGSVQIEDVRQTAVMGIIRYVPNYKASAGEFATFAFSVGNRAIEQLIHSQRADVHVSVDAKWAHGRAPRLKYDTNGEVVVESADQRKTEGETSVRDMRVDVNEPESMFSSAEQVAKLREVISELPRIQAELIRDHYGLGAREERSIRELHLQMGISRTKATKLLDDALEFVAKRMKKATR